VAIHYGNFHVTQKWAGLVQPPDFRPPLTLPDGDPPHVAYVWKTEEKGSDVNLGVHLVRDAFRGAFELAAVLTNDTDLVEPIRIVTQELGLPVTLLSPIARPATTLIDVASNVRHVQPYIGPCQLPDPILVPGKEADPQAPRMDRRRKLAPECLIRMRGPCGNPQARNLFGVIGYGKCAIAGR
jgi:hypothetical protein